MVLVIKKGKATRKINYKSKEAFKTSPWADAGWTLGVEVSEDVKSIVKENSQLNDIEATRARYEEVLGKPVSSRYKNDKAYMLNKINESLSK